VTPRDIAHFTYQLAVLMEAGISVVDGLRSVADQEPNERLREVMEDLARRISAGDNVTRAFSAHRDLFGDVYVGTVHAAEVSGNMVAVLNKLAEMLESRAEMNKAVKGALMYPACVVGVLGLAVTFLLIFVVPKFGSMFAARGVELPGPTQLLLDFSGFMRTYWYLVLAAVGSGIMGLRSAWRRPAPRQRIDRWLHNIPYLRHLLTGLALSRFCSVFGLSLRSGLSLIDALEVSGRASGRPLLQADAEKMQEQVKHGGRLSDVMMRCAYLPGFARRLLTAGEEAAELSRMSEIVARHYEREVTHLTKNVATIVEPLLIVGLAGIVLIIALAIFLPMWNMAVLIR
jgi:type II secretory pathway component PulF